MKPFLKHILVLILLTGMLFSSFRIPVSKMECLGSGKISYSLIKAIDCCDPIDNSVTSMDAACCRFSTINFQTGISELTIPVVIKSISVAPAFSFPRPLLFFSNEVNLPFYLFDTSPPLSGIAYLTLISIFRI